MTALEIPTPDPRSFDDSARPFAEAVSRHYAIKRMIGRGGMGIVYLARDRRLDRLVAIKTLPPHLAADPAVRERFLRETRTGGGMSHPNIVPIHGADEIGNHVFFVMGFIDGESLAAHILAHGQLQPATVVGYLCDVASALMHAHGRGIIHRDIKAENILIERESGRAMVTDFGIARVAESAPLTATGQLLGTVYYLSPEQVSGEAVDGRSDLYALGVVGYFALTGRFPFDAPLASAVLVAHVTKGAPPVASVNPNVPPALAAIIDRCLSKHPEQRHASAADLLAALEAVRSELDHMPPVPGRPRLISDTEAQAVWQRAAELQAATGVQPRPEPVSRPRDASKDRTRTSGFGIDDVRSAAGEAGIGDSYVQHALVEHGLAPGRSAPPVASVPPSASLSVPQRSSFWAGVPLDIVTQSEVNGEISPRDFDRLMNVVREGTAQMGTTLAESRELRWRSGWLGHRLDVSIVPDRGRTTIRLSQSIHQMALLTMATSVAVVGGIAATGVLVRMRFRGRDIFSYYDEAAQVLLERRGVREILAWVAVVTAVAAIPIGRSIVRWLRRQSAARLHTLGEALTAKVRDIVRGE